MAIQIFCITLFTTIILNVNHLITNVHSIGFEEIEGEYCSKRPADSQCCTERDDECTMPILERHLCYCDYFCLQHAGRDCCPDFNQVCLGERPRPKPEPQPVPEPYTEPPDDHRDPIGECLDNSGQGHRRGERYKYNCNECTCGERCDEQACVINPVLLDKIQQNGHYSWQAKNYSNFWGMLLEDGIKYRLGTLYPERSVQNMNEILIEEKTRLPENFDAREKWPSYIHPVRDQKNCGSSWAFSTTAVSADRLAIQSEGLIDVELSPQQLISCNQHKQRGCKGGYLDRAWWYIHKLGVVSEMCYPYRSGDTNEIEQCHTPKEQHREGGNLTCPSGDPDGRAHKTTPTYRISSKVEDIQMEIFLNGPVQATFLVHEDFYMYSGGVYRHLDLARTLNPNFRKSAYHSVRIIGWGVDRSSGTNYWLCSNSWGEDWGEGGFFRIVRGENHCEIESFILAAWGKSGKRRRMKKHAHNLAVAAEKPNNKNKKGSRHHHSVKHVVRRLLKH